MHPLDGPRLKIRRAESHIKGLQLADANFRKFARYGVVVAELNPRTKKYMLRALVNILPPEDLGICIGEAAHNLRSALDGLTWQLALLNTDTPADNTQFPIFMRGTTKLRRKPKQGKGRGSLIPHFAKDGRNLIRSLRPEHQAAFEALQPYKRGNRGDRNPLYLLQELNNADKHRLLQVAGGKPAGYMSGGVWGDDPLPDFHIDLGGVFEDGAIVGHLAASDASKVRVDQMIPPFIGFWKGCPALRGAGVCLWLSKMAEHVSEIVESFVPEFE